jgi:hypothetical protein
MSRSDFLWTILCLLPVLALLAYISWKRLDDPANEFEELRRIRFEQSKWSETQCIVSACKGLEYNKNNFTLYGIHRPEENGTFVEYNVGDGSKCPATLPHQRACYWSLEYNKYSFRILSAKTTIFWIITGSIFVGSGTILTIIFIVLITMEFIVQRCANDATPVNHPQQAVPMQPIVPSHRLVQLEPDELPVQEMDSFYNVHQDPPKAPLL